VGPVFAATRGGRRPVARRGGAHVGGFGNGLPEILVGQAL